jgi:hypothetical protein
VSRAIAHGESGKGCQRQPESECNALHGISPLHIQCDHEIFRSKRENRLIEWVNALCWNEIDSAIGDATSSRCGGSNEQLLSGWSTLRLSTLQIPKSD